MQNRNESSAEKGRIGDVYRISVKLQKTLHTIVTDIKDSADNLTVSSNKLIKMAQDTQESVNDVYQAVGRSLKVPGTRQTKQRMPIRTWYVSASRSSISLTK